MSFWRRYSGDHLRPHITYIETKDHYWPGILPWVGQAMKLRTSSYVYYFRSKTHRHLLSKIRLPFSSIGGKCVCWTRGQGCHCPMIRSCELGQSFHPGGGGTPLYWLYRYVLPHRVGFLYRFGLKTGIHFPHFGLESGMVLGGTRRVYERIYRFNSNLQPAPVFTDHFVVG